MSAPDYSRTRANAGLFRPRCDIARLYDYSDPEGPADAESALHATLFLLGRLGRDIALATATSTAIGYTYAAHAPLLPLISEELALSDVQAGLIATALFLAASVTMIVAGDIADRRSPSQVVGWGLALALAGNVASGLAPSYAVLLLAKAVGGVGAGFQLLAGLRYIARRYEGARSHFGQGLFGAGYPLGSAIALWISAPLAVNVGWRGTFLATSVVMAIVIVVWRWHTPVAALPRPGTMLDAARCLNCWWTGVQHAAGFGLVLAAGTWVTTYVLREFRLPLEMSGLLGSLLLVVAIVARPLGGWLAAREHLGSITIMRGAQVTILAGLALLAFPERPLAVAMLGTVAVGLGGGLPYAAVFNVAAASLPTARSAAQGLTALGGLVGTLAGAPAMGYAIQTWGFASAWMLLAGMSALALAVTFVMRGEERT